MLPIHHFANTFHTLISTIFIIVFTRSGNTGHDKITLPLKNYKFLLEKEFISLKFANGVINVRVIKSRRMRWAGHVARMGEERRVYRVLVGNT